ncbi:MAG: response regulator transcription factor [Bacteroidetes bacterium]|nr:response regulator transcription factor [Bacteroidota bacterium]MCB0844139.1 response regulator transcription factor [Bacteroidota bacterium]
MNLIRTLVIDDEPEAREGVKQLVEKSSDNVLSGVCKNGLEAIQKINSLRPDLIFLDIQMPEINGFDVLNSIDPHALPSVIFITAYDQYALKAFELHAVDYLLKPFTDQRFYSALGHANQQIRSRSIGDINVQLASLLDGYKKDYSTEKESSLIKEPASIKNPLQNRLIIKSSGKIYFIQLHEIIWIEAYDYYVKIHVKDRFYLLRESMKNMEVRLPSDQFVRIHKSSIINVSYIQELEPYYNGEFFVKLSQGEKLKLSRSYRENLMGLIGEI